MNMDAFFANNFPAIVGVAVGFVGGSVGVSTVYTVFYTVAQCDLLQLLVSLLYFTRVHGFSCVLFRMQC